MQIFVSVKIWEGIVTDVRAFQKKPRVKKADKPDEYWDNGVKIFELIAPKIKKSSDTKIDQILISAEFIKGHNPKIKKTTKKIKPKLLLELILFFFLFLR